MKFFVTGVGGQLGHGVMNELLKRGHGLQFVSKYDNKYDYKFMAKQRTIEIQFQRTNDRYFSIDCLSCSNGSYGFIC